MAEKATSLSLTPFLEMYELKGYTLVEISLCDCGMVMWHSKWEQLMVEKPKFFELDDDQSMALN